MRLNIWMDLRAYTKPEVQSYPLSHVGGWLDNAEKLNRILRFIQLQMRKRVSTQGPRLIDGDHQQPGSVREWTHADQQPPRKHGP